MRKARPVESLIFDGMETAVRLQAEAAEVSIGNELTKRLLEPRQSINSRTRAIETDSPLFYGTIHPTLF